MDALVQSVQHYLPNLLGALAILIGGVLAAWIIARLVRAMVARTGLGNSMGHWIATDTPYKPGCGERVIGQVTFWLLFLLVLAGFFEALRLPIISDPLINMLRTVFAYLPRLLAAAGLTVLAWIIGASVRMLIIKVLGRINLDGKISNELAAAPGAMADNGIAGRISLTRTLGDLACWLVFLFFIPPILDTLGLRGLLTPVQEMLNKILIFLPNLLVAGLILCFGYFAAKIVSRIVTNLLETLGLNRLGDMGGQRAAAGQLQFATLIGYVVFVLIVVTVTIAALQSLQLDAITHPAEQMLTKLLAALPNMFAAAALLVIAYYVGRLLAEIASGLLNSVGFDQLLFRMGLTRCARKDGPVGTSPMEPCNLSTAVGTVVLVAVMLISAEAALRLVNFEGLADLLKQLLAFLGHLILGLIVIGLGLYLGAVAARQIRYSSLANANVLASFAHAAIIIFMGAMGLEQMDIGQDIIRLAFGLMLGAVAVAVAIAFGVGSRELAGTIAAKYLGHLASERKPSNRE